MPFCMGFPELLLIVLIIVILFFARRIPELMRGLGSGIKEFKKAANDISGAPGTQKKSSTSDS